ncbi:unnamed protein product [Brassica rapa subsp. trilocularis]
MASVFRTEGVSSMSCRSGGLWVLILSFGGRGSSDKCGLGAEVEVISVWVRVAPMWVLVAAFYGLLVLGCNATESKSCAFRGCAVTRSTL